KMVYSKVNDILMRNIVDPEYEQFKDTLIKMNELAKILRKEKVSRGYIDFELDEAKIVQDETGKAIDIKRRIREDGEKLIEDFMIAANESVAERFSYLDLPFIYRVHDIPDSEKISKFLNLIKILGYQVTSRKNDFSNKGLQNLLEELSDKKEFAILSSLLLRSMKKAVYQTDNIGHFGLASKMYCHFTSPIRRYPDLTVHRLIRLFLLENKINMETINAVNSDLDEIALQCSEREQAAEKAERDVEDMKMAEYMESHIGETFHGVISTITTYGFFVELDNLIEGLVHINSLKGDYYVYVEDLLSLIGQNTKKTYRLGDEVDVKLVGASKETSMIDFELVGDKNGDKK
ncbi:MAG TPA: RNB domain-containing ribonuclease, partial [Bacilli bacterium]|nr:RNB domain-containing ribonuclease [Bacilli bacterium]